MSLPASGRPEGAYDALRCDYDGVLIYGKEEIFKPGTINSSQYCAMAFNTAATVVNQEPVRQREELAQKWRAPAARVRMHRRQRDLPVVVIPYTGDSISCMASADRGDDLSATHVAWLKSWAGKHKPGSLRIER